MNTLLKNALQLAQPLCLIWLLLGLWLLRQVWTRRSSSLWVPGSSWVMLTVISCTPLASVFLASLEDQIPKVQLDQLPAADAILCLGGGAEPSPSELTGFHLKNGADRLSTALTLAAAGKAPVLILGGGGFPHDGKMFSEADAVRDYLSAHVSLQIQMHSIGTCSDTHDEALKVADLMKQRGLNRLLLVTSASHMPRAVATFSKAGVQVTPVPCNYLSSLNRLGDLQWVHWPSHHGFEIFAYWMHEVIGHCVYRWRGWV